MEGPTEREIGQNERAGNYNGTAYGMGRADKMGGRANWEGKGKWEDGENERAKKWEHEGNGRAEGVGG